MKKIFSTGYRGHKISIFHFIGKFAIGPGKQFITINRIKGEFDADKVCYLEDNLVILHEITKDNILKSIYELHKWMFYRHWVPLTTEQLEKYFYPKEDWLVLTVTV